MKKMLAIVLSFVVVFSTAATCFANNKSDVFYDSDGNKIKSIVNETNDIIEVKLYVNGKLNQKAIVNLGTEEIFAEEYETNSSITLKSSQSKVDSLTHNYQISDFMSPIEDAKNMDSEDNITKLDEVSTKSALDTSSGFNILKTYRTDYLYRGNILKAETKTRAQELGKSYRYNKTEWNFTKGDLTSVVLGVAIATFGTWVTVAVLISLGLPIVGAKLIDGFKKSVCYTSFKVDTRVYCDNIYTANVSKTFNKVIVIGTEYNDDYYGYDIVSDFSSMAANKAAKAFNDKYITGNKPNLSLPITSL
ncbi:hypothetical protein [Anaerotignum sp.]|uniref:hypothetical protein n=1 Tax=Anaerotignum sp. TaxID=2039241 RepID=UPI0028AFBAF0|nr:hypothetical protein [Anaerotignum sp.]